MEHTTTSQTQDELSFEELMETLSMIPPYKKPEMPGKKKESRMEKIMAKFGWYRQTTVYMIDKEAFQYSPLPFSPSFFQEDDPVPNSEKYGSDRKN